MKKQELKTSDFITLCTMFMAIVLVCALIVGNTSPDSPRKLATRSAENISAQLLNLKLKNLQKSGGSGTRGIASREGKFDGNPTKIALGPEGLIGKDPWGRPFQYRFVEGDSGQFEFLIVWSPGPDGKPVINYESLELAQVARMLGKSDLGDDVGIIHRTPKQL